MNLPEIHLSDKNLSELQIPVSSTTNPLIHLAWNVVAKTQEHIDTYMHIPDLYETQLSNLDIQLGVLEEAGFLKETKRPMTTIMLHYINEITSEITHRQQINLNYTMLTYPSHVLTIPSAYRNPSSFIRHFLDPGGSGYSVEQVYSMHRHWINQIIDLDSPLNSTEKFEIFMMNIGRK